MSGYPDATLGRVQNDGYSNAMQAYAGLRSDVNEGVRNQIAIMQQWRDREENNREAQRQREWNEAQEKLKREHDSKENELTREHKTAENELDREQKYVINAQDNLYADERSNRSIQAQKEMNAQNNWASLLNKNADNNLMLKIIGLDIKDKKGNYVYDKDGQLRVDTAKAQAMGLNQLPIVRE